MPLNYEINEAQNFVQYVSLKCPDVDKGLVFSVAYNAASKGLVTVWDIIMQDWRNIPAAACNVIMAVAVEPQEKFWKWFDMKIKPMTTLAKESFINEANTTSYGTKPSGKSFYNVRSYGGRFYKVK